MRYLALYLARCGIPFWTAIQGPLEEPTPSCLGSQVGLPIQWKSAFIEKATIQDFATWEFLVCWFLLTLRGRATILMGGLMWHVALKYGPDYLVGIAAEGPSDPERGGWASFAKDIADRTEYWDDVLAPEERRLLCGTYIIILGTTLVSSLANC
jgi:hypothetical protein